MASSDVQGAAGRGARCWPCEARPAIPGCAVSHSRCPRRRAAADPVACLCGAVGQRRGLAASGRTTCFPARAVTTLVLLMLVAAADLDRRRRLGLAGRRLRVPAAPDVSPGRWCCRSPCRPIWRPTPSASSSTIPGRCRAWSGRCSASQTIRDYWFPDIRSTPGCAFVLSSVLYPYVYLTTRIVFLMQGRNIADVARTLGARPSKVFWRVLLPVARPAIVAGVALVLMETINDIGAAEYLGVQHADLRGLHDLAQPRQPGRRRADRAGHAGRWSFLLLVAEQWARRRQRFHTGRATADEGPSAAHAARAGPAGAIGDAGRDAAGAVRLRHSALGLRPICVAAARPVPVARPRRRLPQQPADGGAHRR